MTIRSPKEYQSALYKAAILMDAGFNGCFEKERYFREIFKALVEYEEKMVLLPINQPIMRMQA
jgi:hypothetical protein